VARNSNQQPADSSQEIEYPSAFPREIVLCLSAVCWLLSAGCAETYTYVAPDINLELPDDLPQRLAAFRSGAEDWHGNPRMVADIAIRRHLDVPWKAEPFRPARYSVQESPEWGTFVVRGYVYPSGHLMRYRVKIRKYYEIWYPIQISHYKMHELSDDDSYHPDNH